MVRVNGTAASELATGSEPVVDHPWAWHLARATAITLVVLLPLHLISFHLWSDDALTIDGLATRWEGPWRIVDWVTLTMAALHGALAVQAALAPPSDPASDPAGDPDGEPDGEPEGSVSRWRSVTTASVVVLAAVAIGTLSYAVFSFDVS